MKRRLPLDGKTWTRNSISVWNDIEKTADERRHKHPAMFPLGLATRVLNCFSLEGDVVLDPFLGSGTTLLAAQALDRQGIGIELSEEYYMLAQERLGDVPRCAVYNDTALALPK